MIRALILVAVVLASVLVASVALSASWASVVALAILAAVAIGCYAARLWAERDGRLDANGRENAKKAAELSELLLTRTKAHEEQIAGLRRTAPTGLPSMMPGQRGHG